MDCNKPENIKGLNIDPVPPYCREGLTERTSGTIDKTSYFESQKDVAGRDLSWLEEATQDKMGHGQSALCDPQQTGHIVNDQGLEAPNRNVVYRYQKSLRGTDEAVMDLFRDIIVQDEKGKDHQIPIIWATQERAVAFIIQDNMRKDESLVVDRIRLPMMAIHSSGYNFNKSRYTYHKAIDYLKSSENLWRPGFVTNERTESDTVFGVSRGIPVDVTYDLLVWTLYEEDINQIMTQILTKFSPLAYIRVRGIAWEIGVSLDSIANNIDTEPGDKKERVIKYQISLTAESFVAQPIVRRKSALATKIEITNSVDEENITGILQRIEENVKDLND